MNNYEAKQEAKRDRLNAAADRAEERAAAAFDRGDLREEKSGIPLGQPILVGHHSEGRHRRAIARADNAMRKSIDEGKRAGDLRARAAAVGQGGISSDDPEAIRKLQAKINKAENCQAFMKAANKVVRAFYKAGVRDADSGDLWLRYLTKLNDLPGGENITPAAAAALLQGDFAGRIGFADYQLTNNNANIRRMKQRLAQLEASAEAETVAQEFDGFELVENTEANRVQFMFEAKPDANVRAVLKSKGFRWAPSQGAWQRHLNNAGRYAAQRVINMMTE